MTTPFHDIKRDIDELFGLGNYFVRIGYVLAIGVEEMVPKDNILNSS